MALGLSFAFDANKETPQSVALKRELMARMMGDIGGGRSPQTWGEGIGSALSSIGKGIAGNVMGRRAQAGEDAGQARADDLKSQLMAAISGRNNIFPPAPSGSSGTSFSENATPLDPASARVAQAHGDDGMTAYQNAIASIESAGSGDYGAIGPSHPKLGRALGRYQVMEANIGPWSEKHLGQRISADEFMQNPQLQDAIFNGEFGSYVNKYGPEGAAQAWFGGEGGVGKLGRKDSLGTSIGAYSDKFRGALGGTPPAVAANEAMASAGASNGLTPEMLQQWGAANYADPAAMQPDMRGAAPMPAQGMPQQAAPPLDPPRMIPDMPVAGQQPVQMAQAGANNPYGVQNGNTVEYGDFPDAPPPPVQMAQAGGMDLSQIPVMAGGNAGVRQPGQQQGQPDIAMLMQVVSNPFMDEGTKAFAMAQLQQHMQAQDPSNQLDMEYKRAQIGKLNREASDPNSDETFFGNPIPVQSQDGTVSYGQIGNKGTFRPIQLSEGQQFAPPTKRVDAGTEDILVDQAGNVVARIPKDIAGAEKEKVIGKDQGEAAALYDSMTSKMPGLRATVNRLDELTESATYTWAGQTWDEVRKQFGASPRAEAVARSEYTAIVDNQILPLLRDTFGAQFTASEGDRLRDTLGDPNKAPKEKKALLQAFIQQKERDIEGLAQRTGQQPSTPSSKPISEMTDEELEALANGQ